MRIFMVVCALMAMVAGTMSAGLWSELRAERTLVAGLQSRLAAAEQRLSDSMLATSPPVMRTSVASTQPSTSQMAGTPAEEAKSVMANVREGTKDSASRKARLVQIRGELPLDYPGVTQALGLSPDQAGKLLSLLAEYKLESNTNVVRDINGQVDAQAQSEMLRARAEADRKLEESLQTLLGDSGFQQWQDYKRSILGRQEGQHLTNSLAAVGLDLSDAQMGQLTSVLAAERSRVNGEFAAKAFLGAATMDPAQRRQTRYKLQAESDSRVIETMAPNLGKQQLDALRAELKRKRDRTYGDRAAGATKNQSGG